MQTVVYLQVSGAIMAAAANAKDRLAEAMAAGEGTGLVRRRRSNLIFAIDGTNA